MNIRQLLPISAFALLTNAAFGLDLIQWGNADEQNQLDGNGVMDVIDDYYNETISHFGSNAAVIQFTADSMIVTDTENTDLGDNIGIQSTFWGFKTIDDWSSVDTANEYLTLDVRLGASNTVDVFYFVIFDGTASSATAYAFNTSEMNTSTFTTVRATQVLDGGNQWNTNRFDYATNDFNVYQIAYFPNPTTGIQTLDIEIRALTTSFASADVDADGMDDSWETTHFGDTTQTDTGDFDSDGISNMLEYAMGTLPADATSGQLPVVSTTEISNQTYLTMTYRRNTDANSIVNWTVERTTTLGAGGWTTVDTTEVSATPLGGNVEEVVVRSTVAQETVTGQFLRLKVATL